MRSLLVVVGLVVLHAVAVASPLVVHRPTWASAANDLGPAPARPLDHLTIILARPPAQQHALDALHIAQQTAGSPQYHRWLSPTQIGAQFGASDADLVALTGWLRGQGFRVLRVSNSRTFIEIAGTTAAATAAFGVQFHRYKVGARPMVGIDREPTLPARFAAMVVAVTGLSEIAARPQSTMHLARAQQNGTSHPPLVGSTGTHYIGPSDFTTIYDVGPVYANHITGTGQTIGVIGRARVYPPDISNFGLVLGITMPVANVIIPTTGVDPGTPCSTAACVNTAEAQDQFEATLDVQRTGSTAPGSTLQLIVSAISGDEDGVLIALEYAVDNFGNGVAANILSVSFGLCEDFTTQAGTVAEDMLFRQAAEQGQSVFVSAGDAGAAMCDQAFTTPPATQALGMNALCASGAVTCVGGTEFDDPTPATYWNATTGAALSYIPEGAWNEPLSPQTNDIEAAGTGGGVSEFVALPLYQTGVAPANATGRTVPDVAFSAAQHDGYFGCFAANGGDCVPNGMGQFGFDAFAGTSAAAPSMAGVMALVDQSVGANQGAANVRLYELAASPTAHVFHDVTVASSGVGMCAVGTPSLCNNSDPSSTGLTGGLAGYAVTTGYDLASGWGSIDVSNLVTAWAGGMTTPSLKLDPSSITIAKNNSGFVTLEPANFVDAVTYQCSNLPTGVTCSFGTINSVPTLRVDVSSSAPVSLVAVPRRGPGAWIIVFGIGAIALVTRGRRPRRIGLAFACAAALSCSNNANGIVDSEVNLGSDGGNPGHTDAPRMADAPRMLDAPKLDAPKLDAPELDATKLDAPEPDAPTMHDAFIAPDAAPDATIVYAITVSATDGTTTVDAVLSLTIAP